MRFFELHHDLPREGPGDDATTAAVLARVKPMLPPQPEILDIGCGPGAQTLVLARNTSGSIVAVDTHQPYLDELARRAQRAGFGAVIRPLRASMGTLPFAPGSFDLIWSEGAIYIVGFEAGLRRWRPLLRNGGILVVSEAMWLTSDPPAEAREFWAAAYPAMASAAANRATAQACSFTVVDETLLPAESWFADYYDAIEPRITELAVRYRDEPATLRWLEEEQREIDVARHHLGAFGYVFYTLRL